MIDVSDINNLNLNNYILKTEYEAKIQELEERISALEKLINPPTPEEPEVPEEGEE
jgi:hypothetical protein